MTQISKEEEKEILKDIGIEFDLELGELDETKDDESNNLNFENFMNSLKPQTFTDQTSKQKLEETENKVQPTINWEEFLKGSSRKTKLKKSTTLLVIGKTNVLSKFLKTKEESTGIGLNYAYMDVTSSEETDDIESRIDVWKVNDTIDHQDLLSFAINKDTIESLAILICLDITKPWKIFKTLEKTLDVLKQKIEDCHSLIDSKDVEKLKNTTYQRFLSYKEPNTKVFVRQNTRIRNMNANKNQNIDLSELPEGAMKDNFGIPIIISLTKSDQISNVQTKYSLSDEAIDYIQAKLRRICFNYGGALINTSLQSNYNIQLLRDYILHLLYAFKLTHAPQIIERDQLFVPIGWDRNEKIIMYTKNSEFKEDTPFENVIPKPTKKSKKKNKDDKHKNPILQENHVFLRSLKVELENKDRMYLPMSSKDNYSPYKPKYSTTSKSQTIESPTTSSISKSKTKPKSKSKSKFKTDNLNMKFDKFDKNSNDDDKTDQDYQDFFNKYANKKEDNSKKFSPFKN
ncbi:dynein light intermediate chain [Anaeramoeba flamelloides]|uniref:Dynein light intermediate chain n=1 Tax=Anaeramoeba flamelloides TaxID=1746091 RepID=A0ABQ8ZAU7_9EUKA|nr:dynein light intermediate chain [Anaeramoeba flamelloides]